MSEDGTTFMIVLFSLAVLAFAGFFLVRQIMALIGNVARNRQGASKTPARETLDRRYANGEITREEYLTIRDDITRNPDA